MKIVLHHIRGLPRSVRFWTAIIFASLVAMGIAVDYYRFCVRYEVTANIFEGFLISSGYRLSGVFHPINACFLICNAPFFDDNATFVIYRSGRKKWYWQSTFYVVLTILGYYLLVAISTCIITLPISYAANMWSSAIAMLSDESGAYMLSNGVIYSGTVLTKYSPICAAFKQYGLMSVYTTAMALLFYMLSYKGRKIWAFSIPVFVHAILFIIYLDGFFADFSLFTWMNLQAWAKAGNFQKLLFFSGTSIISLISILIGKHNATKADINNLSSIWLS